MFLTEHQSISTSVLKWDTMEQGSTVISLIMRNPTSVQYIVIASISSEKARNILA